MTLISLVSAQTMPNIITSMQLKAENNILITTKEEINSANRITKVLRENNIKCKIYKHFANAYNYRINYEVFNNMLKDFMHPVYLNLTGGTKIISIAAYEAFKDIADKIIYCDTQDNKIIYLKPEGVSENIRVKINIDNYLTAHGYIIEEFKSHENIESEFIEYLDTVELSNFISFSRFIRENIRLDEPNITRETQHFAYYKNYDSLIIRDKLSGTKFKLNNPKFIHGDWLEELTFNKLLKLRDNGEINFDDIAMNLKISKNNIENKIDVAFTMNCKLYVISCKSGMKDENRALYELETLRKLAGGTFGNAYNVITRNPSENFSRRASELGIKLININDFDKYSLL